MNKKLKFINRVLKTLTIALLFGFKCNYCYAIQYIPEVDSNKQWIITFNKPIDPYSIYNNIIIEDSKYNALNDIHFTMLNNGRAVRVENHNGNYKNNEVYTLTITNNVKDLYGKKLVHSKTMKFKIKNTLDNEDIHINDNLNNVPIMGKSDLTTKDMAKYVLKYNDNPKISVDIYELANIFLEEGQAEGVRGDIAFCQSIKETGFFRYGGQVLPEQNNYAGIGALNNEPVGKGAWFKSAREGVRAQIQHLKGYATKDALKNPCIDPRYHILKQVGILGSAPNWENLNGKWAVPGKDYGEDIIYIYSKIKSLN